jgi:hypothetical protein
MVSTCNENTTDHDFPITTLLCSENPYYIRFSKGMGENAAKNYRHTMEKDSLFTEDK